jgi:ubiquinone/menaquinone biosynthesis C-methylase UbiE
MFSEKKVKIGFLNPQKIINNLSIKKGMRVAHFGCGTGFFTFPIAEKVGENGIVYALDVLGSKIDLINSRARSANFSNIVAKKVNLEEKEGSKLESDSMDWVILVNILYQNINKSKIIREAQRILKEGGRALLIEWKSMMPIGPEKRSVILKEDLTKVIRKHGLGIAEEIEVGDFHFGLILSK